MVATGCVLGRSERGKAMGFADVRKVSTAAGRLHRTAKSVQQAVKPISTQSQTAAGAVGDDALAAAVRRFGATWSTLVDDTSTQLNAAAFLANNFAADMACVTGVELPTLLPPWADPSLPEGSASHWKQLP